MRGPEVLNWTAEKLNALSEKTGNLAKDSPKLGRVAGLAVVVLKTCAIIPACILEMIAHLGVLLINIGGALFSKKCLEDLPWEVLDVGRCLFLVILSPVFTISQLGKGAYGVLSSPESEREMRDDINPLILRRV